MSEGCPVSVRPVIAADVGGYLGCADVESGSELRDAICFVERGRSGCIQRYANIGQRQRVPLGLQWNRCAGGKCQIKDRVTAPHLVIHDNDPRNDRLLARGVDDEAQRQWNVRHWPKSRYLVNLNLSWPSHTSKSVKFTRSRLFGQVDWIRKHWLTHQSAGRALHIAISARALESSGLVIRATSKEVKSARRAGSGW